MKLNKLLFLLSLFFLYNLFIDLFNYLEGVMESLWFKIFCKCNYWFVIIMMINIFIIIWNIFVKVDFWCCLEVVFLRGVGFSSFEGWCMVLFLIFIFVKLMFLFFFLVVIVVYVFFCLDCIRYCYELKW